MREPTGHGLEALVRRLRAAGCVFAEEEAVLLVAAEPRGGTVLEQLVCRRVDGEPLEQILGWAEFAGLRIGVEPGVFVPRRRTELLLTAALPLVSAGSVVVELCCGAGALAVALAAAFDGGLELHAADIESAAVRCARRNLGSSGEVHEGDLFSALPVRLRGRVDVLLANAPYVPSGEIPYMPSEARDYEPRSALDGGADGIAIQRRIAADAASWLAPGGSLLIETSERQASATAEAVAAGGLTSRIVASREGDAHVVIGRAERGLGPGATRLETRLESQAL